MKTRVYSDAVRVVLEEIVLDGHMAYLPTTLERTLYLDVMKVLGGIGGKWDKKLQAHVFPHDPSPYLDEILATGHGRNLKQELQAFYTPRPLADRLVDTYMRILPGDSVLEPSAGHGALALAAAVYTDRRNIPCYDIDPQACIVLEGLGFPVACIDFLSVSPRPVFDWVVMNPPFHNGQDMAHILHALQFLTPGGRLVAIASSMAGQRSTKKDQAFAATMAHFNAQRIPLPEGSFKASGTNVSAVVYVMKP